MSLPIMKTFCKPRVIQCNLGANKAVMVFYQGVDQASNICKRSNFAFLSVHYIQIRNMLHVNTLPNLSRGHGKRALAVFFLSKCLFFYILNIHYFKIVIRL